MTIDTDFDWVREIPMSSFCVSGNDIHVVSETTLENIIDYDKGMWLDITPNMYKLNNDYNIIGIENIKSREISIMVKDVPYNCIIQLSAENLDEYLVEYNICVVRESSDKVEKYKRGQLVPLYGDEISVVSRATTTRPLTGPDYSCYDLSTHCLHRPSYFGNLFVPV
jgi:hypothetical protein